MSEGDRPADASPSRTRRVLRTAIIAGLVVFVAIQLVPYGWWHENPPIVAAAEWPSQQAEELARTACYDCHSNESRWPVYSYVAPVSWLVRRDVEAGRDELNFSDWDDGRADKAIESILDGEMPPSTYTTIHRDAVLSDAEIAILTEALTVMEERD